MHNILAEAIVEIAIPLLGEDRIVSFPILTFPDVPKRRPGMPMETLVVCFHYEGGDINQLVIDVVKTSHDGHELMSASKTTIPDEARHFLRWVFTNHKLFDFKQHAPCYIITHEGDRNK